MLRSTTRDDGKSLQLHYTYDALDSITDQNGKQNKFTYFGSQRQISSISAPMGWAIGFAYDSEGNEIDNTDAMGNETSIVRGASGEIASVQYPDSTSLSLAYDNAGNVRQTTNGRGQTINLQYDGAERPIGATHTTSGQHAVTYSYNDDDTLSGFTDGVGTTSFKYLPNGWPASTTYNYATSGLSPPQNIGYTYYSDGACRSITWAGVGSWTYTYDAAGHVASITNPFGETTHWSYDGLGRIRVQNNSNGTKTKLCFDDSTGFLTRIAHSAGLTSLATYDLTYDGGSNTVGLLSGVSEMGGSAVSYDYDALYRLTSEQRTGTAPESNSYSYDLNGNLQDGSYYDAANKINGIAFDADGNQLALGSTTLSWDDQDQLIGAGSNSYGYDSRGARIVSTDAGGVKTFYIYALGQLIGTVNASGTATAVYTWGAGGLISERLPSSGTSRWYHSGPQSETRLLTDETGAVADTYTYTSYGQTVSATGSDPNPFRYGGMAGYYTDPNTGIILCGARWYDPTSTRWLSQDPIGYAGGYNLYNYVQNNPVLMIDPTGLCSNADQLAKDDMLTETMSQCPGCGVIFHGASFMDHLQAGDSAGAQHYGRLFAQEALSLGRGKGFGGLVGRASRTYHDIQRVSDAVNNCFVAGTLVSLADGTLKPIAQVQVGDKVISRDPTTGRTEAKTVTQTYSHLAPQVLTLTFSEPHTGKVVETVTCTPGHPFYVEGVGFILAGDLGIGTQIVTRAGPSLTLIDIEWHKNIDGTPQGAQVYNFTVADDHTYFVGETYGGVWVHNDSFGAGNGQLSLPFDDLPQSTGLHGNKLQSSNPAHVYQIWNDTQGELYKFGESGDGIKNGKSCRAERQVSKLNRKGPDRYSSRIQLQGLTKANAVRTQTYMIKLYENSLGKLPPGNRNYR